MASRESIVNGALRHLGEEPTETLDLALCRPAVRKVLGFLDEARDAVLIAQDWLDARRYVTLQPSGQVDGWKYADLFWLDPKALMVRDVVGCAAWERGTLEDGDGVEKRVIRANVGGAQIQAVLTWRIGWAPLPVYLDLPIQLQLAAMACQPINGDAARADALQKRATDAVYLALGKDGVQCGNQGAVIPDPYGDLRRSAG